MPDWIPGDHQIHDDVIVSSIGPHSVLNGTALTSETHAAWPSADLALYIPIRLAYPFKLDRFWAPIEGGTAGNHCIGLYLPNGTRIVTTGSVAASGFNLNEEDVTNQVIPPGLYYMALANDTTTAQYAKQSPGSSQTLQLRALGCYQEASAMPLPATATFAAWAQSVYPIFGMASEDL